jgi:hypothetical protein
MLALMLPFALLREHLYICNRKNRSDNMSVVCRNIWTALLALVCGMFGTINAATVDYNGSAESGMADGLGWGFHSL